MPEDAQPRVFPALLAESPAVALRKLYKAVATRWEFATRLLESAVDSMGLSIAMRSSSGRARSFAWSVGRTGGDQRRGRMVLHALSRCRYSE